MFWISFDMWTSKHGRFFTLWRYYYQKHWTPFCRVKLRYFNTSEPPKISTTPSPPSGFPTPLMRVRSMELEQYEAWGWCHNENCQMLIRTARVGEICPRCAAGGVATILTKYQGSPVAEPTGDRSSD